MITLFERVGAQKMLAEIREFAKLALPASAAAVRSMAPAAAAAAKPRAALTVVMNRHQSNGDEEQHE
jgi:hypothetical protein